MSLNKVLVLGVRGMLGHAVFYTLSKKDDLDVFGTVRNQEEFSVLEKVFDAECLKKIRHGVDAGNMDSMRKAVEYIRPDIVINCIGLIKQAKAGKDPLPNITLNAQLPHLIAKICEANDARMIHVSTDCVFDGEKGNYTEDDLPDAKDYYGMTKYLGEVDYPHCITIRTSIIGHEIGTNLALVDWFLSQDEDVKGFTGAIYTGFPTIEIARIIHEFIVPNRELTGLFHVSSDPISKYELLQLFAAQYEKNIKIEPYDEFHCDRSLISTRFREKTGYVPPAWPELVAQLHDHYVSSGLYSKK